MHSLASDIIYFHVFKFLSLSDLFRSFQVCKVWSRAAEIDMFWKEYVTYNYSPTKLPSPHPPLFYKPEQEDWCWVAQSKRLITKTTKFTGIGSSNLYQGEWRNGKFHGRGVRVWENPVAVYMGEHKGGQRNGEGHSYLDDGSTYKGHFVNGKMHGKGAYQFTDGERCEGDFVNDKLHGFCSYYWPNGNEYVGQWVDDMKEGQGKFVEKNGFVIGGNWKASVPMEEGEVDPQPRKTSKRLHPSISQAVLSQLCTYFVVGKEPHGQFYFETKAMDTRPHGVCIVCSELCVPKNGISLLKKPIQFGGGIFCECGEAGVSCFAKGEQQQDENVSKKQKIH